ncbi:hypothetical protein GF319_15115 [Candidatus Bathyarchaeota archaeon]|nr:hypothetical protein [Candidatus Bathyarchaeota archaeon]
MSILRALNRELLQTKSVAEDIIEELKKTEITKENYIEVFDSLDLLEIHENNLRRERRLLNLKLGYKNYSSWVTKQDLKLTL